MRQKEDFEELFEADEGWIKGDLNGFRVSAFSTTDVLVGGIRQSVAGVTRSHSFHAFELPEDSFRTPETTGSKSG